MMDWTKQTEEMMTMWTNTQQTVWNSWMDTMKKVAQPEPPVWDRALGMWQTSVENTLKTQADWTETWADNLLKQEGLPEEDSGWLNQLKKMSDEWVKIQTDLWKGWFEMAKSLDPANMAAEMPNKWVIDSQKSAQAWQKHMEQVMNAQT